MIHISSIKFQDLTKFFKVQVSLHVLVDFYLNTGKIRVLEVSKGFGIPIKNCYNNQNCSQPLLSHISYAAGTSVHFFVQNNCTFYNNSVTLLRDFSWELKDILNPLVDFRISIEDRNDTHSIRFPQNSFLSVHLWSLP